MRYILIILYALLCLASCESDKKKGAGPPITNQASTYIKYQGKTMGTTYSITLQGEKNVVSQKQIDSLLVEINLSLSTYIDSSTISKINQADLYGERMTLLNNSEYKSNDKLTLPYDKHFVSNYEKAEEIFRNSDGYFDPTVMPLVNYWGFGYDPKVPVTKVDSAKVKSLLGKVSLDRFNLSHNAEQMVIIKPLESALDFSALAKGYAVDYLSAYLKKQGVKNLMVEIGGEVYATGLSPKEKKWRVGLNTPKEHAALHDFSGIIEIHDKGLASSGNYRIFHEVDGKKYGHELNPKTGYPEQNEVLGVSVIAPTCMEADAVATACMVMGLDLAYKFITDYQQLEACFFISDNQGNIIKRTTPGLADLLTE